MTDTNDYLALPDWGIGRGTGPGLLVLHAWWGLTDFFKKVAYQLAGQGYVALAPDLYGGIMTNDRDEAEQLASKVFNDAVPPKKFLAAVEKLQTHPAVTDPQIGVLGFSMGAFWALELAVNHAPKDISAVVLFYGNRPGLDAQQFAASQAAFLGHFVENDEFEPIEEVRQTEETIRQAGKSVTFHIYPDAKHWFVEDNQPEAYDEKAAKLAWTRTLEFLNQTLKST